MARYVRTLAEQGIDAEALGSISLTAAFGAATIAVHSTPATRWNWRGSEDVKALTAVLFVLRGRAVVRAMGPGDHTMERGDAFLMHSGRPTEVLWEAGSQYLVLLVPADAILGEGIEASSLPLSFVKTPLLSATREFALALGKERGPTAQFSTYVSERLLAEMAFGLVLEGRDALRDLPRGGIVERARTIMLVRRAEPDLGAAEVAADLHVSVRQLQRAFAREGSSPAFALRQLRVELAHSMLRDAQYDALSVDQVARHSGFTSTSAMRRAFDAEGITAPSVVRRTRERLAI